MPAPAPPPAPARAPAVAPVHFADIGKKAKGLLGGDAATGTFQLNPKLTFVSTTQSGVVLTTTAIQKGDKLDASLKAAYTAPNKKYSLDATADPSGKVAVNVSAPEVAPGLKVSGSFALPNPAATAKLSAEFSNHLLAAKATVGLSASPAVELAAATTLPVLGGLLLGAEAGYDTAKAALTKYNIVLGYHASDFQASATLADQLKTLKLSYAHTVSPTSTVGAELSRKLDGPDAGATAFALAFARSLTGGAVAKVKLDSAGTLAALYQTKLAGGEKVVGSLQLAAADPTKGLKYGFALDLA